MSPADPQQLLRAYVGLLVERRVREADVSDGSRVPHGSSKHVKDLEIRIGSLVSWRDRQKRGSEARANYSRLIQRLKGELASARRAAAKQAVKEGADEKWWKDSALNDPDAPGYMNHEVKWEKMSQEPDYRPYVDLIDGADDPRQLAKAKRAITAAMDAGETDMSDGMLAYLCSLRRLELQSMETPKPRSSAHARTDRILRTRDSTGKATARK